MRGYLQIGQFVTATIEFQHYFQDVAGKVLAPRTVGLRRPLLMCVHILEKEKTKEKKKEAFHQPRPRSRECLIGLNPTMLPICSPARLGAMPNPNRVMEWRYGGWWSVMGQEEARMLEAWK